MSLIKKTFSFTDVSNNMDTTTMESTIKKLTADTTRLMKEKNELTNSKREISRELIQARYDLSVVTEEAQKLAKTLSQTTATPGSIELSTLHKALESKDLEILEQKEIARDLRDRMLRADSTIAMANRILARPETNFEARVSESRGECVQDLGSLFDFINATVRANGDWCSEDLSTRVTTLMGHILVNASEKDVKSYAAAVLPKVFSLMSTAMDRASVQRAEEGIVVDGAGGRKKKRRCDGC